MRSRDGSRWRHALGTWVVCLGLVHAVAGAATLDALVRALAGNDEQARTVARQLLPRESVEAVPKLVPLLGDDREADFANEVAGPGRETDRAAVTETLMTLVAPEQSQHIKVRGLRLLPLVVADGYDVTPIAALLDDDAMREKARAALEKLGTREARAALRGAVGRADDAFLCALLNALGQLQDEASVPALVDLARHDAPQVRAAAARALAWTGDPSHVEALQAVRAAADEATVFDPVRRDGRPAAVGGCHGRERRQLGPCHGPVPRGAGDGL